MSNKSSLSKARDNSKERESSHPAENVKDKSKPGKHLDAGKKPSKKRLVDSGDETQDDTESKKAPIKTDNSSDDKAGQRALISKLPPSSAKGKPESKGRWGKATRTTSATKSTDSGSVNSDEEDNSYTCTGNFELDFTELCLRLHFKFIPKVVQRHRLTPVEEQEPEIVLPRRRSYVRFPRPIMSSTRQSKPLKREMKATSVHLPTLMQSPSSMSVDVSSANMHLPTSLEPALPTPPGVPGISSPPTSHPTEPPAPEYSTFAICHNKFQYFMPKVQVDLDAPGQLETVKAVYIRGWKVDLQMMENLKTCWLHLQNLHTLNLWQVGLTSGSIYLLCCFLPLCPNLKQLILDNNPLPGENYHELLENGFLQYLSLKHCSITDAGARSIARAVGTTTSVNTRLLTLDLAGNFIRDEGAICLADALRTNRSLLVLSLANNKVGDAATLRFAEVLSKFPMTHEEVLERRRLISIRDAAELLKIIEAARERVKKRGIPPEIMVFPDIVKGKKRKSIDHFTKLSTSKTRQTRRMSGATSVEKRGQKSKRTDGKLTISDSKTNLSGSQSSLVSNSEMEDSVILDRVPSFLVAARRKKGTVKLQQSKFSKKQVKSAADMLVPEQSRGEPAPSPGPPLLEDTVWSDGQLWLPGNRILLSLNLSRNQIGEQGLLALFKAMQFQTTLTSVNTICGKGLMRLCVHKNRGVSPDSEIMRDIEDTMRFRDPTLKWTKQRSGVAD